MQNFTISDIERLTGIKAHTIRIWEQRYNLLPSHRPANQHRLYTGGDLQQLLQVTHLYNLGFKISQVASMSAEERQRQVRASFINTEHYQPLIDKLVTASANLDDELFTTVLRFVNLQMGVETGVLRVVYPFLQRLGLLWMNGNMMPAQEHFASTHLRTFLYLAIDEVTQVAAEPDAGLVLLMTPEHEYHDLPLLFIQYLMKVRGIPTLLLGANVSKHILETYLKRHDVRIIHYHHITNFTDYNTQQYFDSLCRQFPEHVIVASGGLMTGVVSNSPNGFVLRDLNHLLSYCENPFEVLLD